jgi:hypothetical protein
VIRTELVIAGLNMSSFNSTAQAKKLIIAAVASTVGVDASTVFVESIGDMDNSRRILSSPLRQLASASSSIKAIIHIVASADGADLVGVTLQNKVANGALLESMAQEAASMGLGEVVATALRASTLTLVSPPTVRSKDGVRVAGTPSPTPPEESWGMSMLVIAMLAAIGILACCLAAAVLWITKLQKKATEVKKVNELATMEPVSFDDVCARTSSLSFGPPPPSDSVDGSVGGFFTSCGNKAIGEDDPSAPTITRLFSNAASTPTTTRLDVSNFGDESEVEAAVYDFGEFEEEGSSLHEPVDDLDGLNSDSNLGGSALDSTTSPAFKDMRRGESPPPPQDKAGIVVGVIDL